MTLQQLSRAVGCCLVMSAGTAWAQSNNATLVSVSGYGNFHAGGVVATISGDANGNAAATLEWRKAGDANFRTAHPLSRIGATRFVGSLFSLKPGTSYEARVTLSDPDGVSGSPASSNFQTRPSGLPEPTLRALYVSTAGNDANPGTSPGAPLRTVQRAANLAQAGDLVLIEPGVYREGVAVSRSGTASQPIVFRGNGTGVVLDGADAAIASGASWTSQGGGVFSRTLGFSTSHVVTELGRLYQYPNVSALQSLGAGAPGGFFFDGVTLFVRLADGSSPASHAMNVARFEDGFLVDGFSFIRLENVEIRHFGSGSFGKGVYLRFASDSAVRGCRIHEVEDAGVWIKGGDRNLVEDNEIWDTSIFNWPWDFTKGSSAENTGIYFTDDIGRGNVARRNIVHGTFNGIAPCGNLPHPTGLTNETDAYDNVLYQHTDDGFEAEESCSNVRMWNNRVEDVHMAFAVAPAAVGPTYILRNIAYRFGNTRTSQQDGYTASALKINVDDTAPTGPLYVYHNTFLTDAPGTDAVSLMDPGVATLIRARNNVIAGTACALDKINPVPLDWNADDLYTTSGSCFVRWMGTPYGTLSAFRAGTNQELQGISAPPQLVSPSGLNYRPAQGSPLLQTGLVLPGINDGFRGAAPDIGAYEEGMGFIDVPTSHAFHDEIDILSANGITTGCSVTPLLYCPGSAVNRRQMAIFLLRGEHGANYVPPPAAGIFQDVPQGDFYAPWVERLYQEGITTGCATNPLRYCPLSSVTRSQMAVFLLRAEHGANYVPPPAAGIFQDVPQGDFYAPWVERLYQEGITSGCATNPLRYCPLSSVTRGQMAAFLVRTFQLI